ncbi:bis(5'-nucleosyl)-tetraphosphatase (symmetrical) YqeK [Selenomonas sp. F0473]|uniref:bis(5'-nucleosyl)-tetraphosphatase (symmetrical) YqeK n=1 Tax=Selenomonas sp. F0473 TaxID=999423 RepID=UPI000561627E|nr:bis(5'-nucleosyl)-tetraphosphatase (symmetrical) YqeK [Selenomonas sp. F0473]
MTKSYDEMRAILEQRLSPGRYRHSLGVADTAAALARRFGMNEERARVAGLLHDCARAYETAQLPAEARRRGIPVGKIEAAMPLLLHAYVGAYLIYEVYGVDDAVVAQAVWRHTVGGENMTALDKIVYFADMIEPSRAYPEVEKLRELARTASLDEMVLAGLTESVRFVIQKGGLLHPDTIAARNELILGKR